MRINVCKGGESSLKEPGRSEGVMGVMGGTLTQVSKDFEDCNQALGGNGSGHRREEVKAVLNLIKFIWSHPLALIGFVSTVSSAFIIYVCQPYWSESHQKSGYKSRDQLRETTIYQKLKDGPSFHALEGEFITRKALQDKVRFLITPSSNRRFYPLVIGQHGVGKTTLRQMALPSPIYIDIPMDPIYIDIPMDDEGSVHFKDALQKAIGWSADPILDILKRMSSSFMVIVFKANSLAAVGLCDV